MGQRRGVIFHGTRSTARSRSRLFGDGSEGRWTAKDWCQRAGTTSYNWIIDYDGTIYELAGWDFQAWHAGHKIASLNMNPNWFGVAFAQTDVWEPITPEQYASAGWLADEIARKYRIPRTVQVNVPSKEGPTGFTQHMWTAQGRSSGKTDVDAFLHWDKINNR